MPAPAAAPIDRLTRLEVMVCCRDLVDRYALAVNRSDVDGFVGLFTRDAVWERPGMVMRGHDEIRAFIAQSFGAPRAVRHLNGHCVVDVLDADRAAVQAATTVFDCAPAKVGDGGDGADDGAGQIHLLPPAFLAEYESLLVRVGEDWRISRHKATVRFVSEHARAVQGIALRPR